MKTMSELDDMIQKLCPDGVEFVKLGEVMDISRGASPRPIYKYITEDKDGVNWIKIGDVENNAKYITSTKEKITKEGALKSRFLHKGDFILSNSMSFGRPYILAIDGCIHDGWISMSNFQNVVIPDFLYHILKSFNIQQYWRQRASSGTVSNLNADIVRNTEIPLPPLEIQAEIVRILDKFTKLEAELEAELDCRKRQYEFYRDQLLSFDKLTPSDKYNVVWMKLSEVAFYAKTRISSKTLTPNSYVGVENLLKDKLGRMECTKTPTGMVIEYMPNDILIGNIRPYLRKIWKANCTGGTNGDVLCIRIKKETKDCISTDYLYHVLASELFFNYDIKCSKGAKMPRGDKELIMKYEVPIPPIEEQNRIVAILDRFDALTTSLQHGLPAEITARRQQYEYYRDKLLDFKRKNVQTESNKACF